MKSRRFLIALILAATVGLATIVRASTPVEPTLDCSTGKSVWCIAVKVQPAVDVLMSTTVPKLATPAWMQPSPPPTPIVVSYNVSTRGTITANLDEFSALVNATLNDPRGWTRLGVRFVPVESGGQFTVFLSEASQMTSFSSTICDTTYSCNVGRSVIINQDRWLQGAAPWVAAGGDLLSYRQMVINHETGHWLGHGHRNCVAAGEAAPVMQQQSMGLQGCLMNSWPLSQEMYSPTLGIRS